MIATDCIGANRGVAMKIPFGKYKGEEIASLPPSYLRWMLREVTFADERLLREVERVLAKDEDVPNEYEQMRRKIDCLEKTCSSLQSRVHELESDLSETENLARERFRKKASDLRRKLSRYVHPDQGGSHEAMVLLNQFVENVNE